MPESTPRSPNPDAARERLALLWGRHEQPRRGPRPALSVEQIVRAAVALADAEGLAAVSMSRVAERLGFTTMSLYRYVPAKQDLIELMVDRAFSPPPQLGDDHQASQAWRPALEQWAQEATELYVCHPWLVETNLTMITFGPNRLAWLETALQALRDTRLSSDDRLAAVLTLDVCVRGSVQMMLQVNTARDAAATAFGPLFEPGSDYVAPDRYPELLAVLSSIDVDQLRSGTGGMADEHDFAMRTLLDGLAALIER